MDRQGWAYVRRHEARDSQGDSAIGQGRGSTFELDRVRVKVLGLNLDSDLYYLYVCRLSVVGLFSTSITI